ncbi:MAG: Fic family protein [Isosphaeraceae bacterium]
MKNPKAPPPEGELWEKFGAQIVSILARVSEPTVQGRYVHWDKLRHLTPPEGLTREVWWFGLKLRRGAMNRRLPLSDRLGRLFGYNLTDELLACLHHVDLLAHGAIQQPGPMTGVTNPDARDRYIMRSLIEESITSSQLEGASTTRAVAKEMIRTGRGPRDRDERMIFNNYQTIRHIIDCKNRRLDRDFLFEIHAMMTEGTLDDPTGAGRFRRPDEAIVVGDHLGEVFQVPPPADDLEHRIALMCDFANGDSPAGFVPPMVRAMILHFWLAYEHPFIDGNGRTARALFYWSMLRQGYWLFEFITISRIILKGPVRYGRAFLYSETNGNDLTYFLLYHADVVCKAIDELHEYLSRRTNELESLQARLRGLAYLNLRQRELIDHVLRHPGRHYTVATHRSRHGVVYETARSDLMDLVSRGLLRKHKVGKEWVFLPIENLELRLGE